MSDVVSYKPISDTSLLFFLPDVAASVGVVLPNGDNPAANEGAVTHSRKPQLPALRGTVIPASQLAYSHDPSALSDVYITRYVIAFEYTSSTSAAERNSNLRLAELSRSLDLAQTPRRESLACKYSIQSSYNVLDPEKRKTISKGGSILYGAFV